jgi:hypothetical protein
MEHAETSRRALWQMRPWACTARRPAEAEGADDRLLGVASGAPSPGSFVSGRARPGQQSSGSLDPVRAVRWRWRRRALRIEAKGTALRSREKGTRNVEVDRRSRRARLLPFPPRRRREPVGRTRTPRRNDHWLAFGSAWPPVSTTSRASSARSGTRRNRTSTSSCISAYIYKPWGARRSAPRGRLGGRL